MANFNKVILLGNLTRDIEMRYTQSGTALGKFGMAINRKFGGGQGGGEAREETCFVDLTAWGRQAEILSQYVGKGDQLFIEGRLQFSTWDDKNGGGKRSKLDVVVENFQFVGGRSSQGGGGGGPAPQQSRPMQQGGPDEPAADFDGIPF